MMQVTSSTMFSGGTRWRRFGILFIPGFGALAGMLFLLASGSLAVSISISGIPFVLNASNLSGTGFVQYGVPDKITDGTVLNGIKAAGGPPTTGTPTVTIPSGPGAGTYAADTVTKLDTATITGLNQTVCLPILGTNMQVTTGATTANASSMLANSPDLVADTATFTGTLANPFFIGQDLGVALGGSPNGQFSQSAPSVSIDNVHQLGLGTTAGMFTLHGLNLQAAFVGSCPAYPSPTFP
jgi:hypothetical protein